MMIRRRRRRNDYDALSAAVAVNGEPSYRRTSLATFIFMMAQHQQYISAAFVFPSVVEHSFIKQRVNNIQHIKMVSMTEDTLHQDDPWILLEDLLRKGSYDVQIVQKAINEIRRETQLNIETLEKEVAYIHETIQQQAEYDHKSNDWGNQSQDFNDYNNDSCYGRTSSRQDVDLVLMPALKAVFAGYIATDAERDRLASAHPGDYC